MSPLDTAASSQYVCSTVRGPERERERERRKDRESDKRGKDRAKEGESKGEGVRQTDKVLAGWEDV